MSLKMVSGMDIYVNVLTIMTLKNKTVKRWQE